MVLYNHFSVTTFWRQSAGSECPAELGPLHESFVKTTTDGEFVTRSFCPRILSTSPLQEYICIQLLVIICWAQRHHNWVHFDCFHNANLSFSRFLSTRLAFCNSAKAFKRGTLGWANKLLEALWRHCFGAWNPCFQGNLESGRCWC